MHVDLSAIPTAVWGGITGTGFLSLLFVGLYKGWIVVGKIHDEQMADKDSQIARLWATVESLTSSTQKLTVNSDLSVQLLRSIDKTAAQKGGHE